jgi:hypothetical protein
VVAAAVAVVHVELSRLADLVEVAQQWCGGALLLLTLDQPKQSR